MEAIPTCPAVNLTVTFDLCKVLRSRRFRAAAYSSEAFTDSISKEKAPAFLSASVKPNEVTAAGLMVLIGIARPNA